jgi:hypothetical protein
MFTISCQALSGVFLPYGEGDKGKKFGKNKIRGRNARTDGVKWDRSKKGGSARVHVDDSQRGSPPI